MKPTHVPQNVRWTISPGCRRLRVFRELRLVVVGLRHDVHQFLEQREIARLRGGERELVAVVARG